ncbi:hypothetical protein M9H77_20596 [Catharanthus roseus]|uniref:Uncharacterized protein n=1 Tax=Catharanthus roseus TaxID=4058 RepID=A0ACC0AK04_CATRO|nr:hypothetical protein M9H77_20596 [Catharanthus roseus]
MPMIDDVFSKAYHMLGIPKEIGCSEDQVAKPDFLHYLFNTWLNPLAHKFVRVWTKSVMHFGVKTTNQAESEHSVLKLWLSICHGDLDTVFLNIDSLIEGQIADFKTSLEFSKTKEKFNVKSNLILRILVDIEAFWKTLEIGSCHPSARHHDMDFEMRSPTDLYQISTGLISKVREMRRLAKGVLSPVLPEDLGMTLTSPPKIVVTKGQKKTNTTRRDRSYWEYVPIAHRKIQKSNGSGSGSSSRSRSRSGSGSGSRGRGAPRAPKGRDRGRSRGRSSLSSIVDPCPCSTFPYTNTFPTFIYHFIENWKNVIGDGNCVERVYKLVHRTQWQDGPAPLEHWLETSDSLYIIANAFNLRIILIAQLGSTTVLPLYSYSDCPGGTLVIGFLTKH